MIRFILASIVVIGLITAAVPAASAADVFEDDFDDNDISDWNSGWAAPHDSDIWLINPGFFHPQVIDGKVRGRSGSWRQSPLINCAMARPINISAARKLKFSAGVKLTNYNAQGGDLQIYLFSDFSRDWDGYLFHFDPLTYTVSPRFRIYRIEDRRPILLGSYDYRPIIEHHNYVFERDDKGTWTVTIDSRPSIAGVVFKPDMNFTQFTHVGVMIPSEDIQLDYIRIKGE
jgi:hypothetical protein